MFICANVYFPAIALQEHFSYSNFSHAYWLIWGYTLSDHFKSPNVICLLRNLRHLLTKISGVQFSHHLATLQATQKQAIDRSPARPMNHRWHFCFCNRAFNMYAGS